jgi:hypothetical protein
VPDCGRDDGSKGETVGSFVSRLFIPTVARFLPSLRGKFADCNYTGLGAGARRNWPKGRAVPANGKCGQTGTGGLAGRSREEEPHHGKEWSGMGY